MSCSTLTYTVVMSELIVKGPQAPRLLEQELGKKYGYDQVRIAIQEMVDRGHAFINDELKVEYKEEV
jgi:hypothetical protein